MTTINLKEKTLFAFFDGDNIGATIETLLLNNKIVEAQNFSISLNQAISEIAVYLQDKPNIKVIISGGDDILIKLNVSKVILEKTLNDIIEIFKKNSQNATISCGVGNTIENSIIALDRAKIFGKNQIFYYKLQKK